MKKVKVDKQDIKLLISDVVFVFIALCPLFKTPMFSLVTLSLSFLIINILMILLNFKFGGMAVNLKSHKFIGFLYGTCIILAVIGFAYMIFV